MIALNVKDLRFCWSRIILGTLAMLFAVLLFFQYLGFLNNSLYKLPFRVVVFFFGQIISITFAIWSGVLISKIFNCPHCRQGILAIPLSEIYFFLPSLPFSARMLSLFNFSDNDALLLKSGGKNLTGECPLCGRDVQVEISRANNRPEVLGE